MGYLTSMAGKRFDYNGGSIYYEDSGTGEPIVFLHGLGLDTRMWRPQVALFSKKYRVVAYDMRGYGKSSVPTQTYSDKDDLRVLLEHLKIDRAHIVGLSRGGLIAINFALTYPKLVRSLALIDANLSGFPCAVDWGFGRVKEVGLQQGKEDWCNHEVFAGTKYNAKVVAELRQMVQDYSGWHWLHDSLIEDPVYDEAHARLSEITAPTLVIVGENDLKHFRDIADEIERKIKGTKKFVLSGIGHMSNMEAPGEVNRLIAAFIGRN